MLNQFSRTQLLFGEESMKKLSDCRVIVFGIGGVGGYTVEALIYKTSVCPLARVMRYELKRRRVKKLKVVYSKEVAMKPLEDMSVSCRSHCVCPPGTRKCTVRRDIPGSNAFVPSAAGLIIAGEIIKDLTGIKNR